MRLRYVRSPYIVEINETGQDGSKLELYIWNKPSSTPTTPTYTFSKSKVSTTQLQNLYNISNYIKEFINPISIYGLNTPQEESNTNWCFFKFRRYKLVGSTYTEITSGTYDNVIQVATNGYSEYNYGINRGTTLPTLLCQYRPHSYSKSQYDIGHVNFMTDNIGFQHTVYYYRTNGTQYGTQTFTPTAVSNYQIPIGIVNEFISLVVVVYNADGDSVEIQTEAIEECKYEPQIVNFINREGGWTPLTFYKARTENISVTGTDYKLTQSNYNFDYKIGQYKTFNINGKKTIKLNTGWVDETYYLEIQELLLSENIMFANVEPVLVKTSSVELKKTVNTKLINYTIEFEYAFNLINDVV